MVSRNSKLVISLVAVIVIIAAVAGCIGGLGKKGVTTITISGSTTVQPIVAKAAEKYMDDNGNVEIIVSGGGSSVGVTNAGEGKSDIGMSSRDLKSEEKTKYPDLKTYIIAKDGIAIIIHKDNSISTLTLKQIRGIYNGTYKNWKDLGGSDLSIVVVNRDSTSGTREFFWEKVMSKENFTATALEKNSNGAVQQTIQQTPGAIGYVGLGFVDTSIKAVKIDQNGSLFEPTVQNVLNGEYPISRPLILLTKGETSGLAKEFIDFILSAEGQKIVEEEGFVPLS